MMIKKKVIIEMDYREHVRYLNLNEGMTSFFYNTKAILEDEKILNGQKLNMIEELLKETNDKIK